jgi:hypothetical protein
MPAKQPPHSLNEAEIPVEQVCLQFGWQNRSANPPSLMIVMIQNVISRPC